MSVYSNRADSTPEEIKLYSTAILELLGRQNPMDVLRATPTRLREATTGMSLERLSKPEAPGKWSVRQVLAHLADSDVVWGWRLRIILAHDRPQVQGYDQDAWAERLGWADAEPEESITVFGMLRRWNLRLIERATPEDLARVGVHAERGEESVALLLKLYAGHDILHLRQIDRILKTV